MYRIKLQNTVTNHEYTYDNVIDKNNGKKLFFNFDIDTSNLDNGEYKLTLFDGDNIISTELLKIGDYNSDAIQYSRGNNIYINAKPDIELSEISITENGEYNALSNNAWNKINVNISPKIDIAAAGIKFGLSQFREIPDYFDFSNVTSLESMFNNCGNLETAHLSINNFTGGMYETFTNCGHLKEVIFDNVPQPTNTQYLFFGCSQLEEYPEIDLSQCTDTSWMFYSSGLKNVNYDFYKVQYATIMFGSCYSLKQLPVLNLTSLRSHWNFIISGDWETNDYLTEIGGFEGLRASFDSFIEMCTNLSEQSLVNIINYLYDWSGNTDGRAYNEYYGKYWDYGTDHYLNFGSTNLDKLTPEQIAVATNKGWTLR